MDWTELKKAYEGKRVFVTGHTGFKGAWLVLILKELGAEVKGYSLPPIEFNALYHQARVELYCDSVIADIRNREKLYREIHNYQPDYVFHLAAQALVMDGYKNPVETYQTNVMGTINVLDALRELNKPVKAIMITTDKVYENLEREEPYSEEEVLGGFDPYSNSKACCELAISAYRSSFFHPSQYENHHISLSSARSGNVIGGGDWSAFRIVPDIAKSFSKGESVLLRNPDSVRPWQHVLDPLHGYLVLGAKMNEDPLKYNQAYNFGPIPEDRLTVEDLVKESIKVWGSGDYVVSRDPNKPHEAGLLRLEIKKAKRDLNWQPKYNSKKAIEETISWYLANHNNESARDFTTKQIKTFFGINE